MIIWFLLGILNGFAVALNWWVGVTYGFDFLTIFCITVNVCVGIWCFMKAATSDS